MRRIIRTDGTVEELPAPKPMSSLKALIGATDIDTVNLRHMGDPLHVMLVDDHGWETKAVTKGDTTVLHPVRARKPVNAEATRLYHLNCRPGTTHKIVGDVVVVPDEDFA